jgi:hypothetical protein
MATYDAGDDAPGLLPSAMVRTVRPGDRGGALQQGARDPKMTSTKKGNAWYFGSEEDQGRPQWGVSRRRRMSASPSTAAQSTR